MTNGGDQQQRSAADLPVEVVVHILEYLSLSDRISAGQTCRLWYEASQELKLHRNETVVLHGDLTEPLRVLEASRTSFVHFVFKEVELGNRLASLWERFCPQMQSLALHNCDVSERMFVDILSRCPQLESLCVNGCRELLMSGRVLEVEADLVALAGVLRRLRRLCLAFNRYLSDALFNRFVAVAPALEDLSLKGCHISFHQGLYKKFYPNFFGQAGSAPPASESVLTFLNVLAFVKARAAQVKRLRFGCTLMDSAALSELASVPGLELSLLHAQSCDQLTDAGVVDLARRQRHLTELDLAACSRVGDAALEAVCLNLPALTCLNLRNCRSLTDAGVARLAQLRHLCSLNLSQCEGVTAEGVRRALCSSVNPRLRRLYLNSLLLDEEAVCGLAENLPGLTHLDLGWCFNGVTDGSLQALCRCNPRLRVLKLTACNKVTDAGLTGMGLPAAGAPVDPEDKENVSLGNGVPFYGNKISLRSKAEQEIINDAKRKKIVSQLCEERLPGVASSGYSLVNLKGLQTLDLSGCNRITDVSLKFAFRFGELRHLDLSQCQQITHVGLSYLAVHNPSIETLILSQCYNIADSGVLSFIKCLCRLKHLELKECAQLTDATLQAIGDSCVNLKYLDVSFCAGMSNEAADRVERQLPALTTVHRVGLSPCGARPSLEAAQRPPTPPPPPRRFRCSLLC